MSQQSNRQGRQERMARVPALIAQLVQVRLRLRVDGASIAYELRANSAFNPFKSRVLSGFSLPERL